MEGITIKSYLLIQVCHSLMFTTECRSSASVQTKLQEVNSESAIIHQVDGTCRVGFIVHSGSKHYADLYPRVEPSCWSAMCGF